MAPSKHVVGALLVGLDQLQLVAGHAQVGVAGGEHLGDGRGVGSAVDELPPSPPGR